MLAVLGAGAAVALARSAVPFQFRDLFERIGGELDVDPNVLHAIAWQESGLRADAVSPVNNNGTRDYGLMQVSSSNFPALGLNERTALDPDTNVRAAARLIRSIAVKNGHWLPDLFSVYNAGPSSVAGRVGGPKFDAQGSYLNARYVNDVTRRYALVWLATGGGLLNGG